MANKRKKKKRNPSRTPSQASHPHDSIPEDPRSVAVTVAWMMSTLATGVAMCFCAIAFLVSRSVPPEARVSNPLVALPGVLLFVALVTGIFTLLLTPLVYLVRPTKPPPMVTIVSVCVGVSPWIVVLVRAFA